MATPSRSTFANPRRNIFSTASSHPPAATGPADTIALRPKSSVGSEIFVATRAIPHNPHPACGHPLPFPRARYTAPSGRHIPLLTELETLFDFGRYNYAAPDGALVCESQRDSIHQPRGGATRLPWENVPTNSSTLKELHPLCRRPILPRTARATRKLKPDFRSRISRFTLLRSDATSFRDACHSGIARWHRATRG